MQPTFPPAQGQNISPTVPQPKSTDAINSGGTSATSIYADRRTTAQSVSTSVSGPLQSSNVSGVAPSWTANEDNMQERGAALPHLPCSESSAQPTKSMRSVTQLAARIGVTFCSPRPSVPPALHTIEEVEEGVEENVQEELTVDGTKTA